jgi:cellulose synthase/poly-beta-1,6-N-acetylglucosamine synthase-like glycosyltransferase
MILTETIVVVVLLYIFLVAYLIVNWIRLKKPEIKNITGNKSFTVIIPFRNEEANLPVIVNQLLNQSDQDSIVEILLADDHSEDGGPDLIRELFGSEAKVKLLSLTETSGKKSAIDSAAKSAKGDYLITLDADVEVGPEWISTISSFCAFSRPVMILLPVMFKGERTLLDKLQTIEFMSLMGATAATASAGKPILANGAGLVIRRSVFNEVHGYEGNEMIASGDDVFLLYKVKNLFPAQIEFLQHPSALVSTVPQPDLSSFTSQRLRWGGKAKSFSDVFGFSCALLVLLTHVALVGYFILTLTGELHASVFILCFLAKSAADLLFLFLVAGFYKKRQLLWLFPLEAVLYPIYIVVIGIAGIFVRPKWKGRKV